MGLVISLFLSIFLVIITAAINIGFLLIRRFDITNSLLVSGMVQLITIHEPISAGLRWAMFIGIVLLSLALQHKFKVFRFIFAAVSIFAACVLAFSWTNYETVSNRNIVCGIAMAVVAVLNILSWMGIGAEKYSMQMSAY